MNCADSSSLTLTQPPVQDLTKPKVHVLVDNSRLKKKGSQKFVKFAFYSSLKPGEAENPGQNLGIGTGFECLVKDK